MTSSLAKSKQIIGAHFRTLFSTSFLFFDVPQHSNRFHYIKDIQPAVYFNNQKIIAIIFKQGNRRSHFARTVHFHQPPATTEWSLLLHDAICSKCVTIHCQWAGKPPKLPLPLGGFCHPAGGGLSNGHRQHALKIWFGKDRVCGSEGYAHRHTETHTQTRPSQYFATALAGKVKRTLNN